jgi:hypothetical protein
MIPTPTEREGNGTCHNEMSAANDDNPHGRLIDILAKALHTAGKEGITKQDVLPAVADFLVSLALIMAGEEGARAAIKRIEGRIEDWKAGTFPTPNTTH